MKRTARKLTLNRETLTHLTELSTSRHIVEELTGRALPQLLVRVGQSRKLDVRFGPGVGLKKVLARFVDKV